MAEGTATVDLHAHTVRSDGLLEPTELVRQAAEAGVRLLAITDHDTLAGYREIVATPDPIPDGLEVVPGVELNAVVGGDPRMPDGELHILGLGVDPDDAAFEATLAAQRATRRTRFERMVARLLDIGLDVREALERAATSPRVDDDALGRPTVGRALVAIGAVASVEEAFDRYLSRGRPGYVARDGLDAKQAIGAIRRAGGLPVLAHYREAPERMGIVRDLVAAGLGGLEVHHLSFDRATVTSVGAVAKRLGLMATGGTDYHGDLESYAEAHARLTIPPEVEEAVRRALAG